MSSKLIKPARFNRPVEYIVRTPYPHTAVRGSITILVLSNDTVELQGAVSNLPLAREIFQLGLERLEAFHVEQAAKAAKREPLSLLVDALGNPIMPADPAGAA
jgi:hypothetical protein